MHVAAEVDLVVVELFVILPARVFERVIFGVITLDDYAPGFFAAARAARDLGQQLKSPLGGAEIRHAEPGVYGDHADQSHVVEVVPLGDHLRADHQVDVAGGEFVDQLFKAPPPPRGVAVQARDAEFGVHLFQQHFDLFGPLADILDVRPFALLSGPRDRLSVAAVMEDQSRVEYRIVQHYNAIRTGRSIAAAPAEHEGRIASAVEQHQRLLAALVIFREAGERLVREYPLLAVFLENPAHVDGMDFGQRAPADALVEFQIGVFASVRVVERLHRGRGAAQDDRGVGQTRAHNRRVAPVIARRLFLFVRGLVLFVDDDKADVFQRREDARTGADADSGLALTNAIPFVKAFAVRERRMQNGDGVAEVRAQSPREHRRQRNLRHEHQRRLAFG